MLTSRLCEEKESRKEKARQEHAVERVVVGREKEGEPSRLHDLFISSQQLQWTVGHCPRQQRTIRFQKRKVAFG